MSLTRAAKVMDKFIESVLHGVEGEEFQERGMDARRFPIITEISDLRPSPPIGELASGMEFVMQP